MLKNFNRDCRRWHRWAAILASLPLLVVIVSGLLLQVKKQFSWVQPPNQQSSAPSDAPRASWDELLATAQSVPEANIDTWSDIDRLDVRPSKGIVKIQCKNSWELQCDLSTAKVLSVNFRRSDFIESLHDGSFFGDNAKLWVFLPNGTALLLLWMSGLYLWWLPWKSRLRRAKAKK
ncbi:MAG TPA: PepSY domain-containing protein [Planctomycetaceae bacterium]|nr:PepSY domain-containing protein [Planctomycetaceae bacterium]